MLKIDYVPMLMFNYIGKTCFQILEQTIQQKFFPNCWT